MTRVSDAVLRSAMEADHLLFTRYAMKNRTGTKMLVGRHHHVIADAIDKVMDGEITRLIINVAPGYTKTETGSINFIARGLAVNDRARFMHLSYSDKLALLNSATARDIVKSKWYRKHWPVPLSKDSTAKEMWWTESGGGVYAASTGGQVTGFRAGHMEPGFQGALIIDDPIKPEDAYSKVLREAVNSRYNETIRSRVAIETTPIIIIMQRVHYDDLSGYLLRGGSGEKWHHLLLPTYYDPDIPYPMQYTHGIPVPTGLDHGWLWPAKHNDLHAESLQSHRRFWQAQHLQDPMNVDIEGALWVETDISYAREVGESLSKLRPIRTVIGVDPAVTSDPHRSDETGIIVAHAYANDRYAIAADYSGHYKPDKWAERVMGAYQRHDADAVVVEVNNGGEMCEHTLRSCGFRGRVLKVHASKGKFARAEPVQPLYTQGKIGHIGNLIMLEGEMLGFVPRELKESPNRIDAMVWAMHELAPLTTENIGIFI